MPRRCATCRHWGADWPDDGPPDDVWGACALTRTHGEREAAPGRTRAIALAHGPGKEHGAVLFTRGTFGCVQWEGRDDAADA